MNNYKSEAMNIKTYFLKSGMTLILFMAIILSGCSRVEDDIPEQPQTNSPIH